MMRRPPSSLLSIGGTATKLREVTGRRIQQSLRSKSSTRISSNNVPTTSTSASASASSLVTPGGSSSLSSLSSSSPLSSTRKTTTTSSSVLLDYDNTNNNNRGRRKQHQLVVSSSSHNNAFNQYLNKSMDGKEKEVEELKRIAAMRLFLDSLQLHTANFTLSTTSKIKSTTTTAKILKGNNTVRDDDVDRRRIRSQQQKEQDPNPNQNQQHKLDDDPKVVVVGQKLLAMKSTFSSDNTNTNTNTNTNANANTNTNTNTNTKKQEKKKERIVDSDQFLLKSALRKTIYDQDISKSLILFRDTQRKKLVLPRNTVTDLFFMISQKDPIYAYQIIQYYNSHWDHHNPNIQNNNDDDDNRKSKSEVHDPALDSATKKRLSLYKRMVSSISLLDPYHHNTKQMNQMVHSLLNEIELMDIPSKQMLYPNLVVSLVTQRSNTVGQRANKIYEFMVEHDFEMKSGWLNRIISTSKYNRQNDLPFHDVIKRLVSAGGQLMPDSILPAIQNMFPYTNTEQMSITLEAWLEDFRIKDDKHQQRRKYVDGDDNDNKVIWWKQEDLIDLSTLESIAAGATRNGDSKLILLVWDVLEFSRYSPTETIYENTIITFANDKNDGLRSAFAAMSSMKEDGFVPSRPLIRSISSALRFNKYVVSKARRILTDDRQQEMLSLESDKLFSLESFNIIMSSYAERGDPHDVAGILNVMIENDIKPNADSYSFVIEALGRDIKKRLKMDDHSYKQRNVEMADTILSMMEEDNIAPTTHVIRHYIELLCLAGEIETATSIVEDFLSSSKDENTRVNNITIYRVAIENAILENYEVAKKLCSMTSEHISALHRKIASREQRSLYVKQIEEEAKAKDRKASSYRDRGD